MPFEFVNANDGIDPRARRRIRSHVAMGRNVGKKLMRASRKNARALVPKVPRTPKPLQYTPKAIDDDDSVETDEEITWQIARQVGDGLSLLPFPEQATAASKSVVQRAFSFISGPRHAPELRNTIGDPGGPGSVWVQFMFMDEAYFHCAVAVSVTALNNLLVKQEDPMAAMRHLSHTFRLVNERIAKNETISDTTMAVVVMMSQYERLQGHFERGLIHVEGLQRMIELRGGVSQLMKTNSSMVQKIFRADLEDSLFLGTTTRFSLKDVIHCSTAILGLPRSSSPNTLQTSHQINRFHFFNQLHPDLQHLLIDFEDLATLLNSVSAGVHPKLTSYTFHDTLILLGYRLVQFAPLGGPRPPSRLENAIQLGLIAFIMTLLRGLDRRIWDIPVLNNAARSAAQEFVEESVEEREVLLWLLYIGGTSIFRASDETWLVEKTLQTMNGLGLLTWEDVGQTLVRFPWAWVLHGNGGYSLWQRSSPNPHDGSRRSPS